MVGDCVGDPRKPALFCEAFKGGISGGEVSGPEFSGDEKSYFCAIEHPRDGEAFEAAFWPPNETVVSKPAAVGVREKTGAKIGK